MRRVGFPPPENERGTPLFDAAPPFPVAPRPEAENRVLPLDGTIEGRYAAWRRTEDGARVYEAIRFRACALLAGGAERISVNALMEHVRAQLKLPCNNDFRAPIGRDLIDDCPALGHVIELRKRTAA